MIATLDTSQNCPKKRKKEKKKTRNWGAWRLLPSCGSRLVNSKLRMSMDVWTWSATLPKTNKNYKIRGHLFIVIHIN
jgi:hypothetical protein